ncbi:MAG: hypothetical protein VX693_12485 [Pseudomonadota bacterium]|nr:hypothetical protein [Pseudomonadota bacterium]
MISSISTIFTYQRTKRGFRIVTFCLLVLFLISCDTAKDFNPWASYPVPNCPKVQLLADTNIITAYRSGPGRDITDIMYEAEITGFEGDCKYVGKKGTYSQVVLIFKVNFEITKGPAAQNRSLDFGYFIAIPEFFPKPSGKQEFSVTVRFPKNRNTIQITDDEVEIKIPLKKTRKGPGSKIYIGFRLTAEQLERNRQNRRNLSIK